MTDATLKLIISLQDKASAGLKAIQDALGGVASGVGGVAAGFADFVKGAAQFAIGGLIQKGIEGIAGSIGSLKDGMIGGNAEFERYQTQFGVLLGGADAAKERLADLAKFGATTPFELPEVVRADKIMQSFGLHAQDAAKRFGFAGKDIRTIAGDVASGTGANFEDIASYIGKFASGATGETIARFQELGIVTKTQLTQMGLQFDKGGSLIINSQEDLDRATGILLKGMKDKYGGMMNAQSATFEGMMSNLEDWKGQTLRTLGAPIFDVFKGQLSNLLAFLPSMQPKIDALAQAMAGKLKDALAWLTGTGIPLLHAGFQRVAPVVMRVWDIFKAFGESLQGGPIFAIGLLIRNLLELVGINTGPFQAWSIVIQTVEGVVSRATAAIHAGFMDIAGALSGPLTAAWGWLTGTALPAMQSGWAWLVTTGLPLAKQFFGDLGNILTGNFSGGALAVLDWLRGWTQYLTGVDITPFFNRLIDMANTVKGPIQDAFTTAKGAIQPFIDAWGEGGMSGVLALAQQRLQPVIDALAPLAPSFQAVADAVRPVIDGFSQGGLGGGLSALKDNLLPIINAVSDLRTNMVAFALEGIGGMISKVGEGNPILTALGGALTTAGGIVRDVGGWFQDTLLPAITNAGQGFLTMLMPHLEALGGILRDNVWPIIQDVGRFIGDNLPGFINVVSPLITGLVDGGLSGLELALRAIATVWTTYLEPAFTAIGGWLEKMTGGWDNLARGAGAVQDSFGKVAQVLSGIGGGGGINMADIAKGWQSVGVTLPGFASGVSGYGGGYALVGERGPEVVRLPRGSDVIPNGRRIPGFADGVTNFGGGVGGGGPAVVINIAGSVLSERDLIAKVQAGLLDYMRRSPTGSTGIS